MNANNTECALSKITDAGFFEKLATAVLREADCNYKTLSHPGVNEKGKTVKSPLDAICFIPHAQPRHLIAVHHTTGDREKLEAKWLHDPSTVKTKNGKKPTAPAGDVLKTAEIIHEERKKDPSLEATLILTTNEEPSEVLIRKIKQAEKNLKFHIDIWSRSRISHFLDNEANGQWIRNNYFGEKQQLLSPDLLKQISKQSLAAYPLLSDESSWVERELEKDPEIQAKNGVVFISGHSGSGKSVLCHRLLSAHIDEGGYGLVITHDIIVQSNSLEQAINLTLDQYYSDFASSSPSALSFCSKSSPLLLIIEDINKFNEPKYFVSKILNWIPKVSKEQNSQDMPWKIICPLWPEVITSLDSQDIQKISPLVLRLSVFNKSEGIKAISAKAKIAGIKLSELEAKEICTALGYDPLLIALHIIGADASEADTLCNYVYNDIEKCSSFFEGYTKIDFLSALKKLGSGMLHCGSIEPNWDEVIEWEAFTERDKSALANLVKSGNIIRLSERLEDCSILFRHDRVRDWVMSDAAITMCKKKELSTEIISDPYFSEIIGAVLVSKEANKQLIDLTLKNNPLALFYAYQTIGESHHSMRENILSAIFSWLNNIKTHNTTYSHMRWEALSVLSRTTAKEVPKLADCFKDNSSFSQFAKLRNGDFVGGIELCASIGPGTGAPWRDQQINYALEFYGDELTNFVKKSLEVPNLNIPTRKGLLRMAGYIANKHLGQAIENCWMADPEREQNLENYFWAFAHCCEIDPERYLAPICDAWAGLSDKSDEEHMSSPRDSFAAHEIRWAFRKHVPTWAINYLVSRASDKNLQWPITYLLHGIDHPEAVKYIVHYMAQIEKDLEDTQSFSNFLISAADEWNGRHFNSRRYMSDETRNVLADLWMNTTNEKYIRISAFQLWDATQRDQDLETLSSFTKDPILSEKVLASRLKRSDHAAMPDMISKIDQGNKSDYWWYFGRHLWSKKLTEKLDDFLSNREKGTCPEWGLDKNADHITSELMQNMNVDEAERILLKHWSHLKYSPCFLQTALYIATPALLNAAHEAMTDCPEPKKMLLHASMHMGIRAVGRSGITKKDQLLAFMKYTKFLSDMDIITFWEICNEHGWIEERNKHLDICLPKKFRNGSNNLDALIESLDKTIKSKHHHWIGYNIESLLKAGITWDDILKKLIQWLSQKQELSTLKIVCYAIQYKGNREDLAFLERYRNKAFPDFCELIDDTIFTVKRRSIN